MEAAQLPADALPPGWSSGGAGAGDPESAQRQAQQVGRVLVEREPEVVVCRVQVTFDFQTGVCSNVTRTRIYLVHITYDDIMAAVCAGHLPHLLHFLGCGRRPLLYTLPWYYNSSPVDMTKPFHCPPSIAPRFHRNANQQLYTYGAVWSLVEVDISLLLVQASLPRAVRTALMLLIHLLFCCRYGALSL